MIEVFSTNIFVSYFLILKCVLLFERPTTARFAWVAAQSGSNPTVLYLCFKVSSYLLICPLNHVIPGVIFWRTKQFDKWISGVSGAPSTLIANQGFHWLMKCYTYKFLLYLYYRYLHELQNIQTQYKWLRIRMIWGQYKSKYVGTVKWIIELV